MKQTLRKESDLRPSGLEWIEEIPIKWKTRPLKYIMRPSDERLKDHPDFDTALSVSGYRGVELRNVTTNDGQVISEDPGNYRVVRKGQMVVNTMWLNFSGLGVSKHDGFVSPAYQNYFLGDSITASFAHYLLRDKSYVQKYTSLLYGVRPNSLQVKRHDFERLAVLLPPKSDQQKIADFLDEKTAVLDQIVEKRKRQIELLKEKRAALITQAVTKGLDPDAEMIDSGVEWIGEIPGGWKTIKLKDGILNHFGGTWGDDDATDITGAICVRVADFDYDNLRLKEDGFTYRSISKAQLRSKQLLPNDLLMEKSGGGERTPVGRVVLNNLHTTAVNSNFIETVRTAPVLDPKYAVYLNSVMYNKKVTLKSIKQTTGIQNLDIKSYLQEHIPLPSIDEQSTISNYLDSKSQDISELIMKIEQDILLMQEYRTSLISHAVTGKILIT